MARFSLENDQKQGSEEDINNPYNTARDIHDAEQQAAYDRDFNSIANNYDKTEADPSQEDANAKRAADLNQLESSPEGRWVVNLSNNPAGGGKKGKFALLSRNRKLITGFGIGGGVGLIIAIFMALLPLRLEMFTQNILSQASRIPSYAVQQRTEYLVTRALAARILQVSDLNDGDLVFCKGAGVACSLYKTWTTSYFEKRFNISLTSESNGVRVAVRTDGRTQLGGSGKSWVITRTALNGGINAVTNEIRTMNGQEMRKYIRDKVNKEMKGKWALKRYFGRSILMKKYGVSHWRGYAPPALVAGADKFSQMRLNIRTTILSNTVGRVMPRAALYVACIDSPAACVETLNKVQTSPADIERLKRELSELDSQRDKAAYDAKKRELDKAMASNAVLTRISQEALGELPDDQLKGIISKQLLSKVAGPLAIVGALDLLFRGVDAVDSGVLDLIAMDQATQVYVGMAFGTATGFVTNNDKMKAGHADIEVIGELNSYLDGSEDSPLMAAENGIISTPLAYLMGSTASAASNTYTAPCDTGDGIEKVTLRPGELICDEQKIIPGYTDNIKQLPMWDETATIANAWVNTVGIIFDMVGDAAIWILEKVPGISQILNFAGEIISTGFMKIFNMFYDPPFVGPGAPGANNYVALSGGIRVSENELMQNGIDPVSGTTLGGGGQILNTTQIAAINDIYDTEEQQSFSNKPVLAKLFDMRLKGSIAQQFALAAPSSVSSAVSTLARLPNAIMASLITPARANSTTTINNPFDMPTYGYPAGTDFEVDPDVYDEEFCKNSAQEREDSLEIVEGGEYPFPVYTKSDPCALEKVVTGSLLAAEGVMDDPHSPVDPDVGIAPDTITSNELPGTSEFSTPDNVNIIEGGRWNLKNDTDYSDASKYPCEAGDDSGTMTNPVTGTTVRICMIDGIRIASVISGRVGALLKDARDKGVNITLSSGYRTYQEQVDLYNRNCTPSGCFPQTARPGTSNHEFGVAVDWGLNGSSFCFPGGSTCPGNAGYEYMVSNAARYGFYKHPREAWHWSTDGG